MKNFRNLLLFIFLAMLIGCAADATKETVAEPQESVDSAITAGFYKSLLDEDNPNVAMLNLFMTKMPKGGDLHHHYSGTLYAETYLDWVKLKGWQICQSTLKINTQPPLGCTDSLTVDQLRNPDNKDHEIKERIKNSYIKLLTLWSNKDFKNHFHDQPPPDSNFFNTFGYFYLVSDQFTNLGLKILKERAKSENLVYIETMLDSVKVDGKAIFGNDPWDALDTAFRAATTQAEIDKILEGMTPTLLGAGKFQTSVDSFVINAAASHRGIDDPEFAMRFQTYASRGSVPAQVYSSLLAAYQAAIKSPELIVGVNIVGPENKPSTLTDYTLQMQMYNFLARKYPSVNRPLHAGELTLGMVRPKDLKFHITQAIDIAGAQRIGHGVDLPYEADSTGLLETMVLKDVAVEINLTSNEFILGVKGNEHPYLVYSSYGVPIVISTDDSGVSRNNISNEYMLLASRYQPTYDQLKAYVYNSIEYSFLQQAVKDSLASVIKQKFTTFEQEIADLTTNLNEPLR